MICARLGEDELEQPRGVALGRQRRADAIQLFELTSQGDQLGLDGHG